MPVDYSKKTVKELKQALSERGAKTTGRKCELIERIEAYDRNDDFCGTTVIQEHYLSQYIYYLKENTS
jgi:hypothetical protein